MINFQNLSDKDLFENCKKWGAAVLEARRKFAGLLPEVQRRELAAREKGGSWLKKRGFTCIYDFAGRLAGMSREQVDEVIRMDRRFEDKPVLRAALVNGEVSVNKLARVVSIATVENQRDILGKVEALSNRALEVFVKDFHRASEISEGLHEPHNEQTSLHVQTFELAEDVEKELIEMQAKGIDVNELLRKFLCERKEKLEREKAEVVEQQMQERDDRAIIGHPAKRNIPVRVLRVIRAEFGDRCSALGCGKTAENIHHEKGFAIDSCHDPRYLKPLCKGHHELAHAGVP